MKASELVKALQASIEQFGDVETVHLEVEHSNGKRTAQEIADVLSNGDKIVLVSREAVNADPLMKLPIVRETESEFH